MSDHFQHSTEVEPHRARTRQLLKDHPEIRNLIGINRMTFWYTLGIVAFQISLAFLVRDQSWWMVIAVAYVVGAFANHALFVMIHECAHRLVFKRQIPNLLTGIIANFPLSVPASVSFRKYHLKHHAFQGVYELDADLPNKWEAHLIGHSALGKGLWLLFYPFFYALRPLRLKEIQLFDRWTALNFAAQFAFDLTIFMVWGPKALIYFVLSLFFSIGLHPLGARWIQRHFTTADGDQETFSYYGGLNKLAFNVGFHSEHHDFPSVPWNHLPKIKAKAPEVYGQLSAHQSWTKLLIRFLFDKKLSLWSRVVREERGKVGFENDVTPDRDLVDAPNPSSERSVRVG
ncbi:MAG: fatty acid desaturase [Gemmatimonadales bacterium]